MHVHIHTVYMYMYYMQKNHIIYKVILYIYIHVQQQSILVVRTKKKRASYNTSGNKPQKVDDLVRWRYTGIFLPHFKTNPETLHCQ